MRRLSFILVFASIVLAGCGNGDPNNKDDKDERYMPPSPNEIERRDNLGMGDTLHKKRKTQTRPDNAKADTTNRMEHDDY